MEFTSAHYNMHQLLHTNVEPLPVPVVEWSEFATPYIPTKKHNELYIAWYDWTEWDYTKQVSTTRQMESHPEMGSTWLHTRILAHKKPLILDTMRHHESISSRDIMRHALVVASKDLLAIVDRSFPKNTPEDWFVAVREAADSITDHTQRPGGDSSTSSI
jgi:hypothetical protein